MPPTLYLVRHAEGENNIDNANWKHDPVLTSKGRDQALALRSAFPYTSRIDSVMSSPLRRAIQTASLAFAPTIARQDISYILLPLAQEANGHQCDIGHSPAALRDLIPELLGTHHVAGFDVGKIDTSLLHDGWESKSDIYGTEDGQVAARAARSREWLFARPEKNIVLVTHGKYLHFLTEDWSGYVPGRGMYQVSPFVSHEYGKSYCTVLIARPGTGWHNCEVRLYDFTPESSADDPHLFETEESKSARVQPV